MRRLRSRREVCYLSRDQVALVNAAAATLPTSELQYALLVSTRLRLSGKSWVTDDRLQAMIDGALQEAAA